MRISIAILLILIILNNVLGLNKGKDSSLILLSKTNAFNYNNITNFIVFGDSHTYTGLNYETTEVSPIVLEDKKNWPYQLVNIHNMKLWNFAASGAVVNLKIIYRQEFPIDFLKQYELFYDRMTEGKKFFNEWKDNNTLFGIYIGGNDIFYVNRINNSKNVNENLNDIMDVIFQTIEKIYQIGGRNFLLINLPPFNMAPINANNKYYYIENQISYFNNLLFEKSKQLFNKYSDINIIVYDNNNEYKYIIDNYVIYNFKSKYDYWENNRYSKKSSYFWQDHTHITSSGNYLLAEDMNDLLSSLNEE